ncbi:MAG: hypothetical protein ACKOQ2_25165, partial [Dolichospermum sp.]
MTRYRYSWLDPNAGNIQRAAEGTSYVVLDTLSCHGGKSIRVFDGGGMVEWKCANVSTLTITPLGSPRYDCINGACLNKSQYGTPGIYESISVCEQNCGPGCGGVCVPNADWTTISSLASQVKNK